ncbi:DEAD/DEAH box helicase [Agarivorans sp. B2Z047]|uniref:DEAD/DEAH box helicase n=1 Tax=Agarivorans sp. B2Z047 TaxID=2652721 RepID=UPI0018845886|nr:DEAD/DEAH box helicase family protein [Agarivorans sp. B2Z047]UQN43517.1 DEAD/DEAH box helicase family protein [Agarivorans sp. B2Z047]
MSKLRVWQKECVEKALTLYQQGQRDFFCLACPGAGKTRMAAELAAILLEQGKIDIVLCISPSVAVSQGIQQTFESRIAKPLNGSLGAIGASLTYQAMTSKDESFWTLLKKMRALVIFDEVHHCAGLAPEHANTWGETILLNIQSQAKYTLALSGTPWRSDKLPVTLARYSDESNQVAYDYSYNLAQAVDDKVCRSPSMVLIDNKAITFEQDGEKSLHNSLEDLFKERHVRYDTVLTHPTFLRHVLGLANTKLLELRKTDLKAAGLVVASSINHAYAIARLLEDKFGQPVTVVHHGAFEAQQIISRFKNGTAPWIVSVGMISEGTDIPRLQVCCHLSRVKTELYFRQVLGRVLRRTQSKNQQAWLYAAATPSIKSFCLGLLEDIPYALLIEKHGDERLKLTGTNDTSSTGTLGFIEPDSFELRESKELDEQVSPNQIPWKMRLSDVFSRRLITLRDSALYS